MVMVFLGPGDYLFARIDEPVSIVLGSCVALMAWQPELRLTLATHIMLPGRDPEDEQDLRYACAVLKRWTADLIDKGLSMHAFRLGLFGGSSQFFHCQQRELSVGYKNITCMHNELRRIGLTLNAEDTGGGIHRKLLFNGQNGQYQIQYLDREADGKSGVESCL